MQMYILSIHIQSNDVLSLYHQAVEWKKRFKSKVIKILLEISAPAN